MRKKTLPRLTDVGWAHPYGHGPFSPFLYADGGDGDGSGSSDAGTGDSGDGTGGDASDGGISGDGSQATGSSSSKNGGQTNDGDDLTATVKRLEKELADARKDAGKARTAAKQQAADEAVNNLTAKLGKALGLVKDDTPPDPAKLAEAIAQKDTTISEKESVIRAKDVELAVWARADRLSAKAGALLDSRSFLRQIAELDPSEKGFQSALDQAIKDAVKDNPAFAATASAGKSGGDLSGGTGEGATKKRSGSLAGAVANAYQT